MTEQEIKDILQQQNHFFSSGKTIPAEFRLKQLESLKEAMIRHEADLTAALKEDLGKSRMESYMCEIGLTLSELTWMQKHLRSLMRSKRVSTPLDPLIDAIAAGNTAVVKPSAYAPCTFNVMKTMIEECFPAHYVAVVDGGRAENQALLQQRFDMIFFTGGKTVGREVLRHAAEYLTPVTLELGGKSPCIVDSTAKIRLAAKRIVFGKYLNCGQTCVAPDYILCDKRIRDELITAILAEIEKQFGKEPLKNPNYGKIINEKHFERILGLINGEKLVYGGQSEPESLRIAPTVLNNITWDDAVMGEEIFGPLLPILTFDTLDEALDTVESHPHPLALYFFSEDKAAQKKVLDTCRFGGGCINDTIIHLATSDMPFGGVGESGMGSYHGRVGFETFSHYRSIVDKKTWMDLPIRYQKYTGLKEKMMRMFLK